ncbi:hypothetical protein FNV43_RR24664 [Rhamnella rubrinervis]|uniref:CCHC-type domain-containing protein n=1 Tax=Rhamnella rubrinervis TaxID=2594499 RepID=A0A8K0DLY5_9ROSA|nr:hypothetical protein FNV43_RR24664 [Rhamnella rubrinervis]
MSDACHCANSAPDMCGLQNCQASSNVRHLEEKDPEEDLEKDPKEEPEKDLTMDLAKEDPVEDLTESSDTYSYERYHNGEVFVKLEEKFNKLYAIRDKLIEKCKGSRVSAFETITDRKSRRKVMGEDSNSESKPWNCNNHNNKRKSGKGRKFDNKKPKTEEVRKEFSTCATCGKKHMGDCYRKTRAYFNCGKIGHQMMNCPKSWKGDMRTQG